MSDLVIILCIAFALVIVVCLVLDQWDKKQNIKFKQSFNDAKAEKEKLRKQRDTQRALVSDEFEMSESESLSEELLDNVTDLAPIVDDGFQSLGDSNLGNGESLSSGTDSTLGTESLGSGLDND